jgi:hypothetical protein
MGDSALLSKLYAQAKRWCVMFQLGATALDGQRLNGGRDVTPRPSAESAAHGTGFIGSNRLQTIT